MQNKTMLYALTFVGLYLEIFAAFLLSVEAIGSIISCGQPPRFEKGGHSASSYSF